MIHSAERSLSLALSLAAATCAAGCASHSAHETPSSLGTTASTHGSEPSALDAIVVLGHRPPLSGGALEYETRARVDRGVALFIEGRAPRLMFSGGPSTPEVIEADVMASYAAQHGVPEAALLRERASRDTIENARLSVAMLRRELGLQRRPRIALVTSDYHLERASRLFRCAGAEVDSVSVPLVLSRAERRKRQRSQRLVQIYYWFIDECARAAARD